MISEVSKPVAKTTTTATTTVFRNLLGEFFHSVVFSNRDDKYE